MFKCKVVGLLSDYFPSGRGDVTCLTSLSRPFESKDAIYHVNILSWKMNYSFIKISYKNFARMCVRLWEIFIFIKIDIGNY